MNFTQETIWDAVIVILGIFLFLGLIAKNKKLQKIRKRVEACSTSVTEEVDNASIDGIETEAVIRKSTNFGAIDKILKEYNELSTKLNSDIQLISLFPMLGLFGTVYGLMNAMKGSVNNLDMAQISLALSTTFWGLICAMALKFYAIKFSLKEMEFIENKIAESDRKYSQLISRGKIINKSNALSSEEE